MSSQNTASIVSLPERPTSGSRWHPIIGEEARGLMQRQGNLSKEAQNDILGASAYILGRGVSPSEADGSITGLVVGYVQSGKTLSFTSVIALARDNGFPFVIVITGTSNPLLNQTAIDRLPKDLQIGQSDGPPQWIHLTEPGPERLQDIRQFIQKWRDQSIHQSEKPTLLITVKKQHHRLDNLTQLLRQAGMQNLPTLVIDDEADQASLNTQVKRQQESRTYMRITGLRSVVPHLTYLQYTATPQALLLINIIDNLSPSFVEVLQTGESYVGGREFFGADRELTPVIPFADIPTQPLQEPPPSLLEAMRIFFIGVAAGFIEGWKKSNPNRSMFVHPSRETEQHFHYYLAIDKVREHWSKILALPATNADKRDLLSDFEEAYKALAATQPNMPDFSRIIEVLPRSLNETYVREINTRGRRKTPPIEWNHTYPWILVGGQSMDRGFTIKGLTVTYMPRGIGTGNADTLQQRARFFGYKRAYLGLCRIYLENDVLEAFENYVDHEEEMRDELLKFSHTNRPLIEWKRRFVLSPDLRPCRNNVIGHDYVRGNFGNSWALFPQEVLMPPHAIEQNRELIKQFITNLTFVPDTTYVSTSPAQKHLVCHGVPLRSLLENCLTGYQVSGISDSAESIGLQLHLAKALEANTNEVASVYQMRPEYHGARTLKASGGLDYFMQGRTKTAAGNITYPGDDSFRESSNVSIQIHNFDLKSPEGNIVASNVPLISIWVPRRLELDWIAQPQPTA